MSRPHAAIIYNPVKAPLDRVRRAAEQEERLAGWNPSRWYPTDRDDGGRRAAQRALAAAPDVVIVAGGDGTIRVLAEEIRGTGIPVAVLPSGTGNLLARNLGLPLNALEESLHTAFTGGTRTIDVAVAELEAPGGERTAHVFVVMAGIGLDSEMAGTGAESKKRLGWVAYVPRIAQSVLRNRRFHLEYRIDDRPARSTRAHTIIVGNCGTLTGNMLLIPEAEPDDGRLDVVMLRPAGPFGWARIGTRLTVQGLAHRSSLGKRMLRLAPAFRALVYEQGSRFDIRFDVPHRVELDGDVFGPVVAARVTVHPGQLDVRV
ncbi:diacylglycerol/lipid kinase family protein [Arthrobacter sp. RAF14]|uniref:diacylglycerol/lipid kinase family protein n=1 Tax=Arthrobacter sp. RAF14 TaxID=3233051 RepID=UPI003F90A337